MKGQICHLFGDRENVGKFPRENEYTNITGELKKLVANWGEFRNT